MSKESQLRLNVLCLEDDLKDAELLKENLIDSGYLVSMVIARSQKEFADFLNRSDYDIIIAENSLPQFDALAALKLSLSIKPEIPFICVSGTIGEEKAIELLKQGASDCVIKGRLERLFFSVKRALKENESGKELKQNEKLLRESEERFHLLFDKAPLGYQSLDIDGNLIEVNQQWLGTLGYTKDAVVGKWFGDFLAPEYLDAFRKRFPIFKAQGKIHSELEMLHKNGSRLFIAFDGRIGYNKNGDFKQTHCILQDITERKKLEENLRNSEMFLKESQAIANLGTYVLDIASGKWVSSDILNKIFGIDSDFDKTVEAWASIIHPDWQKIMMDYFAQDVIGQKIKFDQEYKIVRQNDKAVRWVHGIGNLKFNNSDQPVAMFGVISDITERKHAEEALRHSNAFNETLLKTIPFGMDIVDETGTVLFQSDNFKKIFGENAVGRKCWDLYRDDKKKCNDCPLLKGISLGTTKTYESHGVLGNRIFEISHTGMLYEGKKAMLEIFQDITERKHTEQKLLRSEHELKKAQQITHIGSWYLDLATNDVKWTEELYKMYGFNPELPPPPYTEHMKLFTPESWEILSSSLAKTTDTGVPYELELQTVRKDGSKGWMWVRGEAQTDSEGKIWGLWGAAQDISEHKEREEQLKEALEMAAEADRLKSAFLANMSHEIRTPMNGILGFAELLKEPYLTFEEQQDFIQTIQISGARMLNTINSIIDISKIESGLISVDIKETNLNQKIEFIYKFFKQDVENKGLKLLFKNGLPSDEAIIKTDNEKVYGILTNLIKNAIKFTYEGSIEFGYVLKTGIESDSTEHGRSGYTEHGRSGYTEQCRSGYTEQYRSGYTEQCRSAELEFFVRDTGVGIPKNQKGLIFERFRQGSESHNRGYEGSGLGLSICKSYVEMLGGRIWVDSEEGLGSTFYFTIPYNPVLEETSVHENVVYTENKEAQVKKLKILIVEDDEISYSLLVRYVQSFSSEVIHALTGVQAIEACQNNPDLNLILMDIRLPMMSGLEATQQIRQFNKDVIIIAQTAYGFSSDCEKALEAGCNDNITKPIDKNLLYRLIKKYYKK